MVSVQNGNTTIYGVLASFKCSKSILINYIQSNNRMKIKKRKKYTKNKFIT